MMKDKRLFIILVSAFFVALIDQITKLLIIRNLKIGNSISVIGDFFNIVYVTNTGSVFGLLKGFQLPLIFLSFAVIGYILFSVDKIPKKDKYLQFLSGFVMGGVIGNLIDRIFYGHVIDFLDFGIGILRWYAFNIADSFLSISAILLIIYFWNKD